jgi:hypothetical protein
MNIKTRITGISIFITIAAVSCKHEPFIAPTNNTNDTTANITHPKFTKDILPIFVAKCTLCHNNTNAKEGYNFTSYEKIIAKNFVPGNLDETKLYKAITDDNEQDRMPKAPKPRLSGEEVLLIKNWILNGAPNN